MLLEHYINQAYRSIKSMRDDNMIRYRPEARIMTDAGHPSIFRSALHLTAGRHDTAVYVGDSFETNYTGARDVGMRCLLVYPERRQSVPDSERIASVLDIPEILRAG